MLAAEKGHFKEFPQPSNRGGVDLHPRATYNHTSVAKRGRKPAMRPSKAGIAFGAVLLSLCIGCQREEPAGKPGPQPGAADAQTAVAEAPHKSDCICDQCLITHWRSRKLSVEQAEQEIKPDMAHPLFQAEPSSNRKPFTAICRGRAFSTLGRVTVSTPCS